MKWAWAMMGVVAMAGAASAQALEDPGLEGGDFGKWSVNGQDLRITPLTNETHEGHFAAVCDIFKENVDKYRVLHQEFDIEPGAVCQGGVWIQAVDVKHSESYFEIQFWNKFGKSIDEHQSEWVKKDQPYVFHSVSNAVAPAGARTVSIRAVVHMKRPPQGDPEQHFFDDFEFAIAPKGN
jgi:hypothetical protein